MKRLPSVSPAAYQFITRLLLDRAGIALEADKEYLVESRLAPLLKQEGLPGFDELVERLRRQAGSATLADEVVERMLIGETWFFRDVHPFSLLKEHLLPRLVERRATERRLRFWSAGCATGQEPYSLAMLVDQEPALNGWQIDILATDLCRRSLERARRGCYHQLEVNRGLPARRLLQYFTRDGAMWQIRPALRQRVRFEQHNLCGRWPRYPPFDVVFLRNVLIYLETEHRRTVFGKVHGVLRRDGYLFMGGSESPLRLHQRYERLQLGKGWCFVPV